MRGLMALEEAVSGMSGAALGQVIAPGPDFDKGMQHGFNPANPTIAIGPAFGTQLVKGGTVQAIPSASDSAGSGSGYVAPYKPYGYNQGHPVFSPPPHGQQSDYSGTGVGHEWTPQPGMVYAAGVAMTPQEYIAKYGMATYLSIGGPLAPVGGSSSVAPSTPDFSSGSAPVQAPVQAPAQAPIGGVAIGGPGIAVQPQATGQQVSSSAPTLNFAQYFHGAAATGTKPRHGGKGPNLKGISISDSDAEKGIAFNLVLFVGLLYFIGKVRLKK